MKIKAKRLSDTAKLPTYGSEKAACADIYCDLRVDKCIETGNIYISAKEAARELNIDDGCIGRCCRGKLKTYKGLHWAYPTEEELNEFLTQRGYEPNED